MQTITKYAYSFSLYPRSTMLRFYPTQDSAIGTPCVRFEERIGQIEGRV